MAKLGRVAIVGAGAVGLYYGGRLALAGEDVSFLMRSDFDAAKQRGISLETTEGDFQISDPQIAQKSSDIGAVDLVVVAWKATSNHLLKDVLSPLVGEKTQILSLQNGIGSAELIAELFGAEKVIGGLCFVCINRVAPAKISHTAGGAVSIANFSSENRQRLEALCDAFGMAGIPCKASDDLGLIQWQKLVWNVPFNGLAITEGGVDTAQLLGSLEKEDEVRALMVEVLKAAAALGYTISEHVIDAQIERTHGMGAYRPSSMLDYIAGTPVEVDAIWGIPLRMAQDAGAELPHWEALLTRIQQAVA